MTTYPDDNAAYGVGANAGRNGLSWTSATLDASYPETSRQKRAFLEGFEYGEYYRLGETGAMSQDEWPY